MGKTVDSESSKYNSAGKKKYDEALSKVVIRRLPPSLLKETFLEKIDEVFPEGLPDHDYFQFCSCDLSFSPVPFCRAYINFKHSNDILKVKEKLDGYVFTDSKGGQYPVVVEFAPFQGVPRKTRRRKDIKSGTIEKDSDYLSFLESLNQEVEPLPSAEVYLEQQEANKQSLKDAKVTTPLIEFLKMKKTNAKSRGSSQRTSSSSSNSTDKKRKAPREASQKNNTFSDRSGRSQDTKDQVKKGSERKVDEVKGSRKFIKDDNGKKHGNDKKNEESRGRKEKGKIEEKERMTNKERPTSARTWKENRSQRENQRTGSSFGRSSSSRPVRRDKVVKGSSRVNEDTERCGSESRSSLAGENEERKPPKQPADNKERVRNKDRPAQAIYQPRSRSRANTDGNTAKGSARGPTKEQSEKQSRGYRDNAPRDREKSSRERDAKTHDIRRDHENGERLKPRDVRGKSPRETAKE